MVFDSNIDPNADTRGGPLPTDLREGRDIGDAQIMQAFLNLCGKAVASACAFSAGTSTATTAKWNMLLPRLLRHPIPIGSPAQTWTYQDVITAFPEYSFSAWPTDAAILQQLWLASAAPPVPAGAPPFSLESPDGNLEQILALGCADSPNPRDPQAYEAAAKLAYARSGAFGPDARTVRDVAAGSGPGPLYRAVEPADRQPDPAARQHRGPGDAILELDRPVA